MNNNLLIVGAGSYGVVAKEVAESMGCFGKIAFVDDNAATTVLGDEVIGKVADLGQYFEEYNNIFVAIGNPEVKLQLLKTIEEETPFKIVVLVSPKSYVASSAQIRKGSIVEPMAVVHSGCVICVGCIVSAGAVVNHFTMLCDGAHIDCNATVSGNTFVPAGMKVKAGEVYRNESMRAEDLFFNGDAWAESLTKIGGKN